MTVPHSVRDAHGRPIGLGQVVRHDDQIALYQVIRRPESVAQVWFDPLDTRQAEKILAMVRSRSGAVEDVSTWPTSSLHDQGGRVIGFLMPQVSPAARFLREVYARGHFPVRVGLAVKLAHAFAGLHGAGQLMGNLSDWNVMVLPGGNVRLVNTELF